MRKINYGVVLLLVGVMMLVACSPSAEKETGLAEPQTAEQSEESYESEGYEASEEVDYYDLAVNTAFHWEDDWTSCRFGNCLTDGWEINTDDGLVIAACMFGNCVTDGWETTFADGSTATTSCRFGNCLTDGWETIFPDGSAATTTCQFGNCATDGWETILPDSSTIICGCNYGDCAENGYTC